MDLVDIVGRSPDGRQNQSLTPIITYSQALPTDQTTQHQEDQPDVRDLERFGAEFNSH